MPRQRPLVQYALLAFLLAITLAYQVRHTAFVVDRASGRLGAVAQPFGILDNRPVVQWITPPAEQAGLRMGDTVLSVNGIAYRGLGVLDRTLVRAQPGEVVEVQARRPGEATERSLTIRLSGLPTPERALVYAVSGLVLPYCCLALGFWVAFARPRLPMAWLLLALLLGFSNMTTFNWEDREGTLVSSLAYAYHTLWGSSWLMWLLLLGLYFPTRLSWDRRAPWAKWLLIVPHVSVGLLLTIRKSASLVSYTLAAALDNTLAPHLSWLESLSQRLNSGTVALFFLTITAKYFLEHAPDARRRLRLFYAGMAVALWPVLALALTATAQRRDLDSYPAWIEIPCLASTLALPLTLAYLILVHKAVDVRVAIRQGVQYALARGGVMVLQGVLTAALIVTVSVVVTTHRTRLPVTITLVAAGMTLVLRLRHLAAPLARWIDRRFFREAYDAELLLTELSEKVRTMVEANPLLETVASRIASCLHIRRVAVLLESAGPYQPAYALGYEGSLGVPFPNGGTVKYLRQNQGPARVYLEDANSWVNTAPEVSDEERQSLAHLQSELLLPLLVKDRLLGFMSLSPRKSEAAYSRSDLRLLDSVAAQTALALEITRLTQAVADEVAQRERLNRELEIAREVQEHLFPQALPPVAGLDYAGVCQPALGVGGDYYDFLELADGELGIAIGDISGKGISAALLMANLQAALRSQTLTPTEDLAGLMGRLNRLIYRASAANRYATFFYAQYDPATRLLRYVNGGHNPPLLLRREGQIERLETGGTVIGLLPSFPFQQAAVVLAPGDLLVAFTDGISESMNAADEEWGEEALLETAQRGRDLPACELVRGIQGAAQAHAAGAPQHDDMTVVVLRAVGI